MKIKSVKSLAFDEVKLINYARFADHRGYFTETFRDEQIFEALGLPPESNRFEQVNESFSKKNVFRGLHFQWNPFMGKMIRVIKGRMIDFFLDIRKDSPTFGFISCHEINTSFENPDAQWLWVPIGFAHGVYFLEDSIIEYMCTGHWSPGNEAAISVLADDIEWSLCPDKFKSLLTNDDIIMTDKDRNGLSLVDWKARPESDLFNLNNLR